MINEFLSMKGWFRYFTKRGAKEAAKPVIRTESPASGTNGVYEGRISESTNSHLLIQLNRKGYFRNKEGVIVSFRGLKATPQELDSCRYDNGVYYFSREFLGKFIGEHYRESKSDDDIIELLEKDDFSVKIK